MATIAASLSAFAALGAPVLGPGFGGEIFGERQRVLFDDVLGDRRHAIVLSSALLEIAELDIKIARVLSPNYGRRRVLRDAFFAVARAAERRLFLDCIRPSGGRAGEERGHSNTTQHQRDSFAVPISRPFARGDRLSQTKRPPPPDLIRGETASESASFYSIVKAMMLLPRFELIWALPPEPTTMYCLPPTSYEDGGALTPAPVWNCHITLPLAVS